MSFDAIETGNKIRILRETKKWTQLKLAQQIDLTSAYIGKLERGETTARVWVYIAIADLFDVSLDYLLTDISSKPPGKKIKNIICILQEIGVRIELLGLKETKDAE